MTPVSTPEIREWTIYRITNPKGRIYIGKTMDYKGRLRHYKCYLGKDQRLVQRSLAKYGFDNHVFEPIDIFKGTAAYCEGKEVFWIRSYMSNRNKYPEQNGMNLTDGGEGSPGAKRSDAERAKMRERNLGKKNSEHQKKTAYLIHKGNKWSLGRKQPKEEVEKRVSQLRGKKYSDERKLLYLNAVSKRSKPIYQTDKHGSIEKEFPSIAFAQRELKVNNISLVISGKLETTKGFYFKHKN